MRVSCCEVAAFRGVPPRPAPPICNSSHSVSYQLPLVSTLSSLSCRLQALCGPSCFVRAHVRCFVRAHVGALCALVVRKRLRRMGNYAKDVGCEGCWMLARKARVLLHIAHASVLRMQVYCACKCKWVAAHCACKYPSIHRIQVCTHSRQV